MAGVKTSFLHGTVKSNEEASPFLLISTKSAGNFFGFVRNSCWLVFKAALISFSYVVRLQQIAVSVESGGVESFRAC